MISSRPASSGGWVPAPGAKGLWVASIRSLSIYTEFMLRVDNIDKLYLLAGAPGRSRRIFFAIVSRSSGRAFVAKVKGRTPHAQHHLSRSHLSRRLHGGARRGNGLRRLQRRARRSHVSAHRRRRPRRLWTGHVRNDGGLLAHRGGRARCRRAHEESRELVQGREEDRRVSHAGGAEKSKRARGRR